MNDGATTPGPEAPARGDWLAYVVLTLAILFMAGNVIVGRAVRDDVPPAGLTFWRCVTATGLMLPLVLFFMRSQVPLRLAQWRQFLVLGLTWGVGGQSRGRPRHRDQGNGVGLVRRACQWHLTCITAAVGEPNHGASPEDGTARAPRHQPPPFRDRGRA